MFSVDTFKSKFQERRGSCENARKVREWTKRNGSDSMDENSKNVEKTSTNDSSIQSRKSPESMLSGSLQSSDIPLRDLHSVRTPNHSDKDTDAKHLQEILDLISAKKQLLSDPVLKELLQKCENILSDSKVEFCLTELGPPQVDDFVMVKRDQVFPESSAEYDSEIHRNKNLSQSKSFLQKIFKNLAESRRYRKLGRNGSQSSVDLRTVGHQTNISRSFDSGNCARASPALDCPKNTRVNREPSCATLKVLNVCEHCNQPIEEPFTEFFSMSPCIICQESFSQSEMEYHFKKHSSVEEFDCIK